ncbi:hypothetical protein [Embleya sp. NPDC005575]|uniref:DUF4760 domain-containing protein n=1 Tax=Embleya sp. NPDC005575 TaxID=3156892 RepID=UPI0033A5CA41
MVASNPSDGPTYNDARLLIQLYDMARDGSIRRGFLWYLDHFKEGTDPSTVDYEAIRARNPRISDGYDAWTSVASFFETTGVLVRNGVLYGGLVYERWPVEWYWRYLGPLVQKERAIGQVCDTGCFGDNFEWLAEQANAWRRSDKAKSRWLSWRSAGAESGADPPPVPS